MKLLVDKLNHAHWLRIHNNSKKKKDKRKNGGEKRKKTEVEEINNQNSVKIELSFSFILEAETMRQGQQTIASMDSNCRTPQHKFVHVAPRLA